MKKIKLFFPCLLFCFLANSQAGQNQQIKISSFTVKQQLPANVDSWSALPASLLLVAQKPPTSRLDGVRLILQIKSGGAILCSNNAAGGMAVDNFTTRTFLASELVGQLAGCHDLKEGSYMICAQFFNSDRKTVSDEVCKTFTVETPKETDYAPPTLITPGNGKKITAQELMGPVMFRWTPLVPKPKEPVTYRLKVWQLMQGQNGRMAMRTNQPIVTKDVDNITQATVSGIYTGPCRPPYLCDYIWNVQALNRNGKSMGNNDGMSEPYTFGVAEEKTKGPDNVFPNDKKEFKPDEVKQSVTLRWTPVVPKPQESVTYRLKVWQLMQGQSSSQAMRTNKPIVTKDVADITEASVAGIYTGPCRPPYLCDYIWSVEAIVRQATGTTQVIGSSEPTTFNVKESNSPVTIKNVLPEDNKSLSFELFFDGYEQGGTIKKPLTFKWAPVTPKPQEPVIYRLKVWQLMQGQSGSQAMRTNQPIVTKDVDNITEAAISGIYTGPCRPPYLCDYIWNVQVVTRDGTPGATSEPTTFKVTEENIKCPTNTFPEDKKKLTVRQAKEPITFKWTNTATPGQSSTYRLKVWQLMQGQSGSQVMKSNNPVITREIKNATEVTVNGIYTGPCRPPYLCDYIWAVEMIDSRGQSICSGESTTFKIANNDIDIQIDSLDVGCCKNGKQDIYLKIRNNLATPVKITQIKIDKVNGVTANIIPSPLAPALPVTIPGNGTQIFTGQINCIDTAKIIRIWVAAEDPLDNAITETEVEADTLHCACDACDEKHFMMNAPPPAQINTTGNSISFNQPVMIVATPPKTVKTIKAELVYFEMKPENDQCIPCDKDASLYGHFANGTNSQTWTGPQSSLSINITTPITPCCSTLFRWCIRYKVEFTDCTVCTKVICYEKKKSGCIPTDGGGHDDPIKNLPK